MRISSDKTCLKILFYGLHFDNNAYLLDFILQRYYTYTLNMFSHIRPDTSRNSKT